MNDQPKQWQCPYCEEWVDAAWWRHLHPIKQTPTLAQMIAEREKYGDVPQILDAQEFNTYTRKGDEPMREKPL